MDESTKNLIESYEPSQEVIRLVERTSIVLLCGITGAGKDTVKHELLELEHFTKIITSTTRAPRENDGVMEEHGREYYFFTPEQARANLESKRYFEVASVHERINGVTAAEIQRLQASGLTGIADVDYQGVDYFKKYSPSTLAIFLLPPSFGIWMERLKRRYDTDEAFQSTWPARRDSAIRELRWALNSKDVHLVINGDLSETVKKVKDIIGGAAKRDTGREVAQEILDQLENR